MRKIPFLRICLMLILGIYLNSFLRGFFFEKILLTSTTFIALTGFYVFSLRKTSLISFFGGFTLFFFLLLGMMSDEIHDIKYDKGHYASKSSLNEILIFEGEIVEKKSAYFNSYFVDVCKVRSNLDSSAWNCHGLIKLSSKLSAFNIGDEIVFEGKYTDLPEQKNLYTFDYGAFLSRKGYHFQIFSDKIELVNKSTSTLLKARKQFSETINSLSISEHSRAILQAMLLGDKEDLGDLEQIFRRTGTSHVLAISGLHVGIITALLYFVLGKISKRYQWVKSGITITGVWAFCILSGMAPSTLRATIMVSCFLIGSIFNWKSYGLNFCFMAAFFMLVLDPNKIYDIGFQFSFLAIVGILFFYEPIYKALVLQGIYEKLWQMTVLSMSAQIALTPLSLYYFHEFPLLFIVASIIAIPATFVVVSSGLLCLVVKLLIPEFSLLERIVDWFISSLISILEILSNIEGVVIGNLWPSKLEMVLYYILVFSISAFFVGQKKSARWVIAMAFISLVGSQFYYNNALVENHLIVYAHPKEIHFDLISSGAVVSFDIENSSIDRTGWYRTPTHQKFHIHSEKNKLLSLDDNHEISVGTTDIFILNNPVNITDQYDLVLINCVIPSDFTLDESTTYIDYRRNTHLSNNANNLFTNHQFISQF